MTAHLGPGPGHRRRGALRGLPAVPYRATSSKNQSRWQFGVVGPPGASAAGIGEDDTLSAQFLIDGDSELTLVVRFLQLQHRRAERDVGDGGSSPSTN